MHPFYIDLHLSLLRHLSNLFSSFQSFFYQQVLFLLSASFLDVSNWSKQIQTTRTNCRKKRMNKEKNCHDKKEQALDAGLKSSRACPKEIKKLAVLDYSILIQQIKHFLCLIK